MSLSGDDGVLVMHGALLSSLTASSTSWAFWEEAACFVACVMRKRDAEDKLRLLRVLQGRASHSA